MGYHMFPYVIGMGRQITVMLIADERDGSPFQPKQFDGDR